MKNYKYYETAANENNAEEILNAVTTFADEHDLFFMGGGFGMFSMLPESFGEEEIPEEVVEVLMDIATNPDAPQDKICGYFIDFSGAENVADKLEFVVAELKEIK